MSPPCQDRPGRSRPREFRGHDQGRAEATIVDRLVPEDPAGARETMDAEAAEEFERSCREMYHQQARIAIRPW